jgi:hypothetical protein
MASTSARNAAEMWNVLVSRRNASLMIATARSSAKSAGGFQSAASESATAATAETAVSASCPATSARSRDFTARVIGSQVADP